MYNILLLYNIDSINTEIFDIIFNDSIVKNLNMNFYDINKNSYLSTLNLNNYTIVNKNQLLNVELEGIIIIADKQKFAFNILDSLKYIIKNTIPIFLNEEEQEMTVKEKINYLYLKILCFNLEEFTDQIIEDSLIGNEKNDLQFSLLLPGINFKKIDLIENTNQVKEYIDTLIDTIAKVLNYPLTKEEKECFSQFVYLKNLLENEQGNLHIEDFFEVLNYDFDINTAAWFLQNKIFYKIIETQMLETLFTEEYVNDYMSWINRASSDVNEYREYQSVKDSYMAPFGFLSQIEIDR